MLNDIYVIDGEVKNKHLLLYRNDNNTVDIPINLQEKRFTWYYPTLEPTDPLDDPVDPGTGDDPGLGEDPINIDPEPTEPDTPTPIIYNILKSSGSNGSISCASEVEQGHSLTITVHPNEGYELDILKINTNDVTLDVVNNTYTIINVLNDITVSATFKAKLTQPTEPENPNDPDEPTTYNVQWYVGDHGKLRVDGITYVYTGQSGDTRVTAGSDLTLTITPNNGYEIDGLFVSGTDVTQNITDSGTYTIQNIQSDIYFTVSFKLINSVLQYVYATVQYDNIGGAVVVGYSKDSTQIIGASALNTSANSPGIHNNTSSRYEMNYGSKLDLSVLTYVDYAIDTVKINNSDITQNLNYSGSGKHTYSIQNVYEDINIFVTFKKIESQNSCLVTLSSGENGRFNVSFPDGDRFPIQISKDVSPTTSDIQYGIKMKISAVPDSLYILDKCLVNGSEVTLPYVDIVKQDMNISCDFKIDTSQANTIFVTTTGNQSVQVETDTTFKQVYGDSTAQIPLSKSTTSTYISFPKLGSYWGEFDYASVNGVNISQNIKQQLENDSVATYRISNINGDVYIEVRSIKTN